MHKGDKSPRPETKTAVGKPQISLKQRVVGSIRGGTKRISERPQTVLDGPHSSRVPPRGMMNSSLDHSHVVERDGSGKPLVGEASGSGS